MTESDWILLVAALVAFSLPSLGVWAYERISRPRPAARREPRERHLRLVLLWAEPYGCTSGEVTVSFYGPLTTERWREMRRMLQQRQQAVHPPVILSAVELDEEVAE